MTMKSAPLYRAGRGWLAALFLFFAVPALAETKTLTLKSRNEPVSMSEGSVYFVGTATVIIRYAGFTLLTDPNFLHKGDHAHLGYGMKSKRLTDPAIPIEQLPPIDLVVLSHYHGDHFDGVVKAKLSKATPIVCPPDAARKLYRRGFLSTFSLRAWDTLQVDKGKRRLTITAMPGRHGPPVVSTALPEVMGSLLEFQPKAGATAYRMYISGDTLVHDDLKEIPRRYPQIDLALLHLGGTRVGGILVTMDAEQGIQAMHLIDPEHAIPIHYNDYPVFKSPIEDFLSAAEKAGLRDKITFLKHGESYGFKIPAERLP